MKILPQKYVSAVMVTALTALCYSAQAKDITLMRMELKNNTF